MIRRPPGCLRIDAVETETGKVVWKKNFEQDFDGGNLTVNGIVVPPVNGYPLDAISPGDGYYSWCVDGEPGFNGILDPAGTAA